jgi:SAM-dependent methyltransferase
MQLVSAMFKDEARVRRAFRSGEGVAWSEHDHDLFCGCERFFRPGYAANLVSSWLPALDGVVERLDAGITVADVGCGHGASTIVMAQAFPRSRFFGFDSHAASIEAARRAAVEAGVADRVTFKVATAHDFCGRDFELVCVFDALHDMGDPVGAGRHIRGALASGGTWMLVEPMAGESVAENVQNPVSRVFYAASTFICTPNAKSQKGGWALGAQATETQLRAICARAGFTRFRRATETPLNRVYEIRP